MKTKTIIWTSILVFSCSFLFVLSTNISHNDNQFDLDRRYEELSKELEDYGGAMIVKYDTETGEIISKRPAYQKDAGVFSVSTQKEADLVLGNLPDGVEVFIVEEEVTPQRAIEFWGNN